ncbi:MAG: ABC transporter permease, partial [Candidatus Sumerlaeota bacterium]|nr:ABC transporter permease [Candidatus Sumerlaeota bacterium]
MFIPLKYNIRYLVTRRGGTLMTALTFALVVAIFVVVMSLARGMEKALAASGNPLNVLVMRPGVQAEGQSSIQIPRYPIVRSLPGIAVDEQGEPLAGPEVLVLVNKPRRGSGKPSNIQIRGVTAASFKIRPEVKLVEGRMFRPGLREAVISTRAANRFEGMSLGDHPRLGRGEWTIVGVFDAQGSAFDSEMWCDAQELMEEFDRNAYSTIVLRATDKGAVDSIAQLLDADPRVKLTAKTEEKYYQEQTSNAIPLKVFGSFLAVMMSIGACFAGMNTMYS